MLLGALALAGCGGDEGAGTTGDLAWVKEPVLITPEGLPGDRILGGRVRNESLRPIELESKELRVLDASGKRLPSTAVFLDSFAHQLYPPTREPRGGIPEEELLRLGVKARIEPGSDVPLTVAWRQAPGGDPPVRVDAGGASLPVP